MYFKKHWIQSQYPNCWIFSSESFIFQCVRVFFLKAPEISVRQWRHPDYATLELFGPCRFHNGSLKENFTQSYHDSCNVLLDEPHRGARQRWYCDCLNEAVLSRCGSLGALKCVAPCTQLTAKWSCVAAQWASSGELKCVAFCTQLTAEWGCSVAQKMSWRAEMCGSAATFGGVNRFVQIW